MLVSACCIRRTGMCLLDDAACDASHPADLFFSNVNDTDSLRAARELELSHIRQWITEWYDHANV